MPRVIVVGAGISGLSVAFNLVSRGMPLTDLCILESSDRVGGNIRTARTDGFVIEGGPNGFLNNVPATLSLITDLGAENQVLPSNQSSAKRYIFRNGRLRQIHAHPLRFLSSGVLPLAGALRVALEPLIPKGGYPEESVYDFAARRIGHRAATILVDAMVSGVFAGDSRQLELASAFPKMADMEARFGGLVKAMRALGKERRLSGKVPASRSGPAGPGGHLTSFKDGLETLSGILHAHLRDAIHTGCAVDSVSRSDRGYSIVCKNGDSFEAPSVVLACPARNAATAISALSPQLSAEMAQIAYASINVVSLAYRASELSQIPDGFGFLVPRGQGPRILGSLWSSSIFAHRAPPGSVLLHTMIGGAHDPAAAALSDGELVDLARADLLTTMNLTALPLFERIFRYENGIAQYRPGHQARLTRMKLQLNSLEGLFISGSSYGGISVNHCVEEAPLVAGRVMDYLKGT